MTTSKTSKILMDEHKNILKVVDSLEIECKKIASGEHVNETFLKRVIDFIRNYADKFHHAKEEDILFKEFCGSESNKEHCNPTEQMLYEHDLGRKYVAGIELGMAKKSRRVIVENAIGYVRMIRDHISKEDNILFPMADKSLNSKAKNKVLAGFNKIIKEREKAIKQYVQFAGECQNG